MPGSGDFTVDLRERAAHVLRDLPTFTPTPLSLLAVPQVGTLGGTATRGR